MLALLISSACLSNVEPEIVRADAYSGSDTVGFSNGDFLIVYLSPDVNDTIPERATRRVSTSRCSRIRARAGAQRTARSGSNRG
jgi:hypothetical protein